MGRSQRLKGHNWEREVATTFRAIFPDAKRGIGQARNASEVADVVIPGWWVECKVGAHPNINAALKQAVDTGSAYRADADGVSGERRPVAIVKVDRHPPTASVYLTDFVALLQEREQLRATLRDVQSAAKVTHDHD